MFASTNCKCKEVSWDPIAQIICYNYMQDADRELSNSFPYIRGSIVDAPLDVFDDRYCTEPQCIEQSSTVSTLVDDIFSGSPPDNPERDIYKYNDITIKSNNFISPSQSAIEFEKQCLSSVHASCRRGLDCLIKILRNKVAVVFGSSPGCPLKSHSISHIKFYESFNFQYHQIRNVYVYVDGGYVPESPDGISKSSWAVSLITEDCFGVQRIMLSSGGPITFDPHSLSFLGECLPNGSFVAELYGRLMAYVIILQYVHKYIQCVNTPIYIVYDNKSADQCASMSRICSSQSSLSRLANILDSICKSIFPLFSHHVHSHNYHPYNDYVDSICTHILNKPSPCVIPFGPITSSDLDEIDLFCACRPASVQAQITSPVLDPSHKQHVLCSNVIANNIDSIPEHVGLEVEGFCSSQVLGVQYNVCTLASIDERKELLTLCKRRKAMFVGLQETRSRFSGIRLMNGYFVCSSTFEAGAYGCEIWISATMHIGTYHQSKYVVQHNDISIMHASPRLLTLSVRCGPFVFGLVSGHAPHHKSPQLKAWWILFVREMKLLKQVCCTVFCMCDLNSHFRKKHTDGIHIGSVVINGYTTEITDDIACKITDDLEFIAMNTIEEFCSPQYCADPHTFVASDGVSICVEDYFLSTPDVYCKPGSVRRDLSFKHSIRDADHFPISVMLSLPISSGKLSQYKRRIVDYDRNKIGIPSNDSTFIQHCQSFPVVPYNVDSHSHCHILESFIRDGLESAYPKSQAAKRKQFLSDFTHNSIIFKNKVFHKRDKIMDRFGKSALLAVFTFWAQCTFSNLPRARTTKCLRLARVRWSITYGFGKASNAREYKKHNAMLHYHNKHVKAYLHMDRLAMYDAEADKLDSAIARGDMTTLHHTIRVFKRSNHNCKNSKRICRIQNEDGRIASSVPEEKLFFREMFAEQLGGTTTPFSMLIDKCRREVCSRQMPIAIARHVVSCLLGASSSAHAFAWSSLGAPGEDCILGRIYRLFPRMFSSMFFPLVFKTYCRLDPPLQWRGGLLHELFKNKGSSQSRKNYRDIMLGNISGKDITKHVRNRIYPFVRLVCGLSQFGSGLNGGETAFAHLYIRLVFEYCKHNRISASFVFLDIVTAFAVLLRRIIFSETDSDESWLRKLNDNGFSNDEIKCIYDTISDHDWFSEATDGDPTCEFLMHLLNSFYKFTWFSQESISEVVHTTRGSLAGTPPADIIYAMAFARVISRFHSALICEGLQSYITSASQPPLQLQEVTYCDDTAFPVVGAADEIVGKTCRVVSLAFLTFAVYGLALSFENKKSEVVPMFVGPNSNKARRDLAEVDNIKVFECCGRFHHLRFVDSYKHVGGNFSVANDLKLEVVSKAGYIRSSVKSLRRVLCCPHVPLRRKLTCIQAHLLAGGLYISGTWSHIPNLAYNKLFHSILYAYRMATNNLYNPVNVQRIFSDSDLVSEFNLIAPMSMIRSNRITLFHRIIVKGPPLLNNLIIFMQDVNYGWIDCIKSDLSWLSLSGDLSGDSRSLSQMADSIRAGFPLSRVVKKFAISSFANIIVPNSLPQFAEPIQHPCQCADCDKHFSSYQRMMVHRSRKHDYLDPINCYVSSNHCPICMLYFHSRVRVLNHIKYRSFVCKANLLLAGPILLDADARALDVAQREQNRVLYASGLRAHAATLPVFRLQGPLPPSILPANITPSEHHLLGNGRRHYC